MRAIGLVLLVACGAGGQGAAEELGADGSASEGSTECVLMGSYQLVTTLTEVMALDPDDLVSAADCPANINRPATIGAIDTDACTAAVVDRDALTCVRGNPVRECFGEEHHIYGNPDRDCFYDVALLRVQDGAL